MSKVLNLVNNFIFLVFLGVRDSSLLTGVLGHDVRHQNQSLPKKQNIKNNDLVCNY